MIEMPKLTDANYAQWSNDMQKLLRSKELWNHCLTEEQQLAELTEFLEQENSKNVKDVKWFTEDQKCRGILGLNVSTKFTLIPSFANVSLLRMVLPESNTSIFLTSAANFTKCGEPVFTIA